MIKGNIIADSCFWFALYNIRENKRHEIARNIYQGLGKYKIIVPYPTLYETLNSEFVDNTQRLNDFLTKLNSRNFEPIDDTDYKKKALEKLSEERKNGKQFSLVDSIIREMIEDQKLKIRFILTFNRRDFEDLSRKKNIPILDHLLDNDIESRYFTGKLKDF